MKISDVIGKSKSSGMSSRRLFIGLLVPLLSLTIIAGVVFAVVNDSLTSRYVRAEASSVIANVNGQAMNYITPAIVNAEDFVNFASLVQDARSLDVLVHTLSKNLSYVISIYFATPDFHQGDGKGFLVISNDWVPPDTWRPVERGWYKKALEHDGDIAYEDVYVDATTGELCLTISKSVRNARGELLGVVAVDLLLSDLVRMVESFSVSQNSHIYLVSKDGTYISHPDTSKVGVANYFEDSGIPFSAGEFLDGKQKALVDGGNFYAVDKIGDTPWFIVAEGPISDFSGNSKRQVFLFELLFFLFSVFCSIVNIRTIKNARVREKDLGKKLFAETVSLAESSKENATTAQDQSAAVKEVVATMEDNTTLSENISQKIKDVSAVASKTSGDVAEGVSFLEENVRQLHEIAEANMTTIDGIKALGDKINNIWDIVTLINSVADQAKIIAFNAELEASSAGEAGKNFHIVATEIRRLADGIIDGTKEIKERINEIQQSSDNLILTSESGTEKIKTGVENAKSLGERFTSIRNASEITAGSAGDITTIIQQQAHASEQILATLRQIAGGVEKFSQATGSISAASENVRAIAEELGT